MVNLASPRLGTVAVRASDEFFAAKERMLADSEPVFIADKYDDHGKWMDGWESRRRRDGGEDWCLIRLGVAGMIHGVDIDTRHFTGNYPPAASIEACAGEAEPGPDAVWTRIVAPTALGPGARHFVAVAEQGPWNWVRVTMHPDGGIARLRLYGQPVRDWSTAKPDEEVELSALRNGGRVVAYNNAHYGNVWALLTEGRGRDMGDGWETRRRREPGNDWLIVALGTPGVITRIEVDTAHFKGNFPDRCSLQAALVKDGLPDSAVVTQAMFWPGLVDERKLRADSIHGFDGADIAALGPVSHVKLNIHPDGGVSRLRIFGRPAG
ncbi:allantoicase [Oceanibacterium hippocampi]